MHTLGLTIRMGIIGAILLGLYAGLAVLLHAINFSPIAIGVALVGVIAAQFAIGIRAAVRGI